MAINKVQYELLLKQKEKLKKTENQLWAGIIIILIIFYFIFGLIIGFLITFIVALFGYNVYTRREKELEDIELRLAGYKNKEKKNN